MVTITYVRSKCVDCSGIPKIESTPAMSDFPDANDNGGLLQERRLLQVEALMDGGENRPAIIGRRLGIARDTARLLVRRIEYRRQAVANGSQARVRRNEARCRMNLLTNEIWNLADYTESEGVRLRCLQRLLQVHDRLLVVDALSEKSLSEMSATQDCEASDLMPDKLMDRDRATELADAIRQYLDRRSSNDEL